MCESTYYAGENQRISRLLIWLAATEVLISLSKY